MISDKNRIGRKRLLMLAYVCSPYRGSERAVGWHRALQAPKYCDTWVLCKEDDFANDITRWIAENGEIPGLSFVSVPMSRFAKLLEQYNLLWYFAYNLWQRRAYRTAERLHKELEFDLVHHVTICGFREPGYLWKLDAPFIWGPVGGTQNYPWRFLSYAGIAGGIKEGVRTVINSLQLRFSPRVRMAIGKAATVLVANSAGKEDIEHIYKVKPIRMLETGLKDVAENPTPYAKGQEPLKLKILWSGVFEHRKALHLLLLALNKLPLPHLYELHILGKGPLEGRWYKLAKRLGVESKCTWLGWLPYHAALQEYAWADVFVFTSLRDTSGNVVLEALSKGVPVICLDHQGVGDIITGQCGIKIPVTSPKEVVAGLRDAIVTLLNDRQRLGTLSKGAIDRSKRYLWEDNGRQMGTIYKTVWEGRSARSS